MEKDNPLLLRNHRSTFVVRLRLMIGSLLVNSGLDTIFPSFLTNYYKIKVRGFEFQKSRLDHEGVERINQYVHDSINPYIDEQNSKEIEKLSQFYPYKNVPSQKLDRDYNICNIGVFYAGADALFLKKNSEKSRIKIYGLDFGNIKKINDCFSDDRLILKEGYPLTSLEAMNKTGLKLDLSIFVRTACKLNNKELREYLSVLSTMCDSIMFLEIAKLAFNVEKSVNIKEIDKHNSLKLYAGLYLHNYTELLKECGFTKTIDEKILPYDTFEEQGFSKDHDFIYVHATKE